MRKREKGLRFSYLYLLILIIASISSIIVFHGNIDYNDAIPKPGNFLEYKLESYIYDNHSYDQGYYSEQKNGLKVVLFEHYESAIRSDLVKMQIFSKYQLTNIAFTNASFTDEEVIVINIKTRSEYDDINKRETDIKTEYWIKPYLYRGDKIYVQDWNTTLSIKADFLYKSNPISCWFISRERVIFEGTNHRATMNEVWLFDINSGALVEYISYRNETLNGYLYKQYMTHLSLEKSNIPIGLVQIWSPDFLIPGIILVTVCLGFFAFALNHYYRSDIIVILYMIVFVAAISILMLIHKDLSPNSNLTYLFYWNLAISMAFFSFSIAITGLIMLISLKQFREKKNEWSCYLTIGLFLVFTFIMSAHYKENNIFGEALAFLVAFAMLLGIFFIFIILFVIGWMLGRDIKNSFHNQLNHFYNDIAVPEKTKRDSSSLKRLGKSIAIFIIVSILIIPGLIRSVPIFIVILFFILLHSIYKNLIKTEIISTSFGTGSNKVTKVLKHFKTSGREFEIAIMGLFISVNFLSISLKGVGLQLTTPLFLMMLWGLCSGFFYHVYKLKSNTIWRGKYWIPWLAYCCITGLMLWNIIEMLNWYARKNGNPLFEGFIYALMLIFLSYIILKQRKYNYKKLLIASSIFVIAATLVDFFIISIPLMYLIVLLMFIGIYGFFKLDSFYCDKGTTALKGQENGKKK
jgi:hypothetical protein